MPSQRKIHHLAGREEAGERMLVIGFFFPIKSNFYFSQGKHFLFRILYERFVYRRPDDRIPRGPAHPAFPTSSEGLLWIQTTWVVPSDNRSKAMHENSEGQSRVHGSPEVRKKGKTATIRDKNFQQWQWHSKISYLVPFKIRPDNAVLRICNRCHPYILERQSSTMGIATPTIKEGACVFRAKNLNALNVFWKFSVETVPAGEISLSEKNICIISPMITK